MSESGNFFDLFDLCALLFKGTKDLVRDLSLLLHYHAIKEYILKVAGVLVCLRFLPLLIVQIFQKDVIVLLLLHESGSLHLNRLFDIFLLKLK